MSIQLNDENLNCRKETYVRSSEIHSLFVFSTTARISFNISTFTKKLSIEENDYLDLKYLKDISLQGHVLYDIGEEDHAVHY